MWGCTCAHTQCSFAYQSCRRLSSRRRTACVHLVSSRLPKHASLFNAICTGYAVPHVRFGQTRRSMHPMFPPWYCPNSERPNQSIQPPPVAPKYNPSNSNSFVPFTGATTYYEEWRRKMSTMDGPGPVTASRSASELLPASLLQTRITERYVVAALIQRRRYPYVLSIEASTT